VHESREEYRRPYIGPLWQPRLSFLWRSPYLLISWPPRPYRRDTPSDCITSMPRVQIFPYEQRSQP
jgi:hypothetical protein